MLKFQVQEGWQVIYIYSIQLLLQNQQDPQGYLILQVHVHVLALLLSEASLLFFQLSSRPRKEPQLFCPGLLWRVPYLFRSAPYIFTMTVIFYALLQWFLPELLFSALFGFESQLPIVGLCVFRVGLWQVDRQIYDSMLIWVSKAHR